MIELSKNTLGVVKKAVRNKNNTVMNILSKKTGGATELSRLFLGKSEKDRKAVVDLLTSIVPEDCGKVLCTFS